MSDFVKGIDYEEGVARVGGREPLFFKLLLKFANEDKVFPPFAEFMSTRSHEEIAREVHSYKGIFGNLSINGLYKETIDFEHKILDGTATEAEYDCWVKGINEMKQAIKDRIV